MPALATFANVERASSPAQRAVARRPDVDLAHRSGERDVDRAVEVVGDAERPHEVPSGSPRDDRELDVGRVRSRPFTTSFTEPSPPTTTRRRAPSRTASAASSPSRPGASEMSASPSSPRAAARCAISGQRFPVEPAAEAGLTRKTVRPGLMAVVARRGGVERDPRHPVDRGAELLVGDPDELALDDDVADREQAARRARRGARRA